MIELIKTRRSDVMDVTSVINNNLLIQSAVEFNKKESVVAHL